MSDPRRESADLTVPELEVPDLELEPVASKRSIPARPASLPAVAQAASPATGSGLPELDLEAGAGVVLGSSDASSVQNYFGSGSFGSGDFEEDALLGSGASLAIATEAYERAASPRAPGPSPAGPTGRTPSPDQIQIEAIEVERAAAYGPRPRGPHQTPLYALRVMSRQGALRKALRAADAGLSAAEAARDQQLAEMTFELRPKLEESERFRRLLLPLVDLDRALSEQGLALSEVNSEYETRAAGFDGELASIRADIAARSTTEQALAKAFFDREANWKRADAKLKRTNIEIRNLIERTRQPEGAAALPPDKSRELTALNERLSLQKSEATQARAEHDLAQAELSSARHAVLEAQKQAHRVEQELAALGQKYQKRFDVQNQGLSDVELKRIGALADVARAVLEVRADFQPRPETLAKVAEADRAVAELAKNAAIQLRALDAYDPDALQQGRSIVLFAAAALLILIALKFLL